MSLKQRTFISLDDIQAVEYECPACDTRQLTALAKFKEVPANCPACRKEIISTSNRDSSKASDWVAVDGFLKALKEIQGRRLTALRLEISAE